MIFRVALLLLLAPPGDQADVNWLSVKEWRDINALLTRGNSLNIALHLHEPGARGSGDVGCVLRYDSTKAYLVAGKPGVRVKIGPINPPEVVGAGLCTSGAADGAKKRGNCASQIVVNTAQPGQVSANHGNSGERSR